MQISKETGAQAERALCRRDGAETLGKMFERGVLDRQFALKEIGRSVLDYNKFYRIEILCEVADIRRAEVRRIAIDICNRLLKVGDDCLAKGKPNKASDIETTIENIICDHGLVKDEKGNESELMKAKIGFMLRIMEKKGDANYPFMRDFYKRQGYAV
jgi:hypothetical protein